MWQALSGVIALVVVAMLNIGALVALGGPGENPIAQIMTTALWALQAPLAAILLNARGEKPAKVAMDDAGGANVFALSVTYAIAIFVLAQLTTFLIGGATFYYDWLTRSLCGLGHQDRCAQIPPDPLAAMSSFTGVAGGLLALLVALACFGVAGYRIGWRARGARWIGAVLTPILTVSMMLIENLVMRYVFGDAVDPLVARASVVDLLLARAPLAGAGIAFGLVGFAWSLRLNRPARRYAFAVARASRRKGAPPPALKAEFLRVMGFSPEDHDLTIRRRPERAPETTTETSGEA